MKVICISHDDVKTPLWRPWNDTDPQIGDTCEVVMLYTTRHGVNVYKLKGYCDNYDVECFAPCSDISETSFERNYNKVTV